MLSIRIRNTDVIAQNLDNLNVQGALQSALGRSLLVLEREMKKVTPIDQGFLVNSYEGDNSQRLTARLNNFREYGPIVDKRQGFVERGVGNAEPLIQNVFNKEIDLVIKNL